MSNIRKSKNREDMPDFDKMWGEVQEEIQEKDAGMPWSIVRQNSEH